jgi:hypothetical protein
MSRIIALLVLNPLCVHSLLQSPLALWTLQEPTGVARVSSGIYAYKLIDGNTSHAIERVTVNGSAAPFGEFAAKFSALSYNNSARLYASRDEALAITEGISGPNATVTLVTWISLSQSNKNGGAYIAGVWDEYGKVGGTTGARAYALFLNLAICQPHNGSLFAGGVVAHISPVGGPTPGNKYCTTAACDSRKLDNDSWHCIANTYDGNEIRAYVNGTFITNSYRNPFQLNGGIFDPESSGAGRRIGAEFGVGANRVNLTDIGEEGFRWANTYEGLLGGIAVWNTSLSQADVIRACALGRGF